MEWLPLVALGIMWLAFLLPRGGRWRSTTGSVDAFERGLELLAYSEVHGTGGRWIVTPRKGVRFVGAAERRRARARERRRRVFVGLLEAIGITGLIGAVPPLRAMWFATAALVVVLLGYGWLLRSIKARERAGPPARPFPATSARAAPEPAAAPWPPPAVDETDLVHVVVRPAASVGA